MRKLRRCGGEADGRQQSQVHLHNVRSLARIVHPSAARVVHVGIERPRHPLAKIGRREADDPRRAREPGENRRLEQPLKIEDDVVARPPKLANRRRSDVPGRRSPRQSGDRPRSAILDHQPAMDHRHQIQQVAMPGADEPVDSRGRKCPTERRGDRNGVDDVAQGAETDEKEPGQVGR